MTYSFENPKETFETNTIGILNLLDILKRGTKTKSVVILTTDKVYKDKNKKNIYGKASIEDVKELKEEGIETSTIPWIEGKEN